MSIVRRAWAQEIIMTLTTHDQTYWHWPPMTDAWPDVSNGISLSLTLVTSYRRELSPFSFNLEALEVESLNILIFGKFAGIQWHLGFLRKAFASSSYPCWEATHVKTTFIDLSETKYFQYWSTISPSTTAFIGCDLVCLLQNLLPH